MTDQTPAAPRPQFPLYLDEPTNIDLLSFDAVAGAVVEALLDERLDPIALGLSGSWGSGKTSVLRLIAAELKPAEGAQVSTLVVETDPWRYDPQIGAKESLIGEILESLGTQIVEGEDTGDKAKKLLARLVKRVDWGKALQVAAKSAITVTLPSVESVLSLVKPKSDDDPEPIQDMVQFRAEFAKLLESDALAHIKNVVILVDDLDRCLPATVVETLETIRLFLSVPKMSFVIAADEQRIAEAIATHFPQTDAPELGEEKPSTLYLHKIVQTSVPVPALSDFDTEAYLVLLQIQSEFDAPGFQAVVGEVAKARREGRPLDDVAGLAIEKFNDARTAATRLKPIVHEKTKGNPRRIKRFMNDLSVRQGIAWRRGIELDSATVAKLMVLEAYFPDEFKKLTMWLSENTLRANLRELEAIAGLQVTETDAADATSDPEPEAPRKTGVAKKIVAPASPSAPKFSDELIRWAHLSPTLSDKDIASYLVFAASFKQIFLSAPGLSERVRDLATRLLSSSISDNRSVTDEMIEALPLDDSKELISHIGGVIVDQPDRQTAGVAALLRFARRRADCVTGVVAALKKLPAKELKAGAIIQLNKTDPKAVVDQMTALVEANGSQELKGSLSVALEQD